MTSMMEMRRQMNGMFATFVPRELFAEFYEDLIACEPDIVFERNGKYVKLAEVPCDFVMQSGTTACRDDMRGFYVYVLFGRELFLAGYLGNGYQYVELDEVWQRDALSIDSISDDVLAEML